MPVGAGQLERDPLRVYPFAVGFVGLVFHAKRPEMDVFDMADVVALVDEDAPFARVAGDIADQVAMGANQLDGLVGIQKATFRDAHVVGVVRFDAGRIGHRRHVGLLPLGILDDQAGDGGVLARKADEGGPCSEPRPA